MIDAKVLRDLGWSEELIESATRIAEPMRHGGEMQDISVSTPHVLSVGCTAVYAECAIHQSLGDYRIDSAVKSVIGETK